MLQKTVDTLNYMIAGYAVIFGAIMGYLISLMVRVRNARDKVQRYQKHLEG